MHAPATDFPTGETRTILGVPVTSLSWDGAIAMLKHRLVEKRFTKVTFLNAHNANLAFVQSKFTAALSGFLILPDGVGVDIASKLLYGAPFPANLNGTDFVPALLRASPEPMTIGLIGATRKNLDAAVSAFSALSPQHRFVAISDGFFDPAHEPRVLSHVLALHPDILLVAMGVPRQEMWIARNVTASHCTMPIAVGALFDFMSGAVPRAPQTMRKLRAEWLFRLMVEPSRMWRRYILGNPLFMMRVVRQKLAQRGRQR